MMASPKSWKSPREKIDARNPEHAASRDAAVAALRAEHEQYQRTLAEIRKARAKTQVEVAAEPES